MDESVGFVPALLGKHRKEPIMKAMKVKKTDQKITRTFLKELRDEINRKLKSVAEEHEIEIDCGNCSYGNNEATYRLKINLKNEDGKVMTKEYENLLNLADLKGFDINGIYDLNGRKVSLEGYNYRAKKYPLQVMDLNSGDRRKVSQQWFDTNVANKESIAMLKGAEIKKPN